MIRLFDFFVTISINSLLLLIRDTDILDNVVALLEKYANHLEDLVEERTNELIEEKKKTDDLLYRMLPK